MLRLLILAACFATSVTAFAQAAPGDEGDDQEGLQLIVNQQEALKADLDDGGIDQRVCWRERVTGTNLKRTRCGTRAEVREAREGARDFMERPKTCGEGCGS